MYFLYKTYFIDYEYINCNKSKTILFLHGWGGNKNSFAYLKKFLKPNFNLLSISFPPNNIYTTIDTNSVIPLTMHDYKNIVLNILKLLNISSLLIVAHSFGMRISLMLATSVKIEKIIITGGAGIKLNSSFIKKLDLSFIKIFLHQNPQLWQSFASSDYKNLDFINRQTFKNIVNINLVNRIKFLTCPTFLFWGTNDKSTPLKMFKIFKKLNPNIKYKLIKHGSHFCYLEYSNCFVDCCLNFFS